MPSKQEILQAKIEYLAALEEKEKLIAGLPHLHRYKFYHWSRKYFESTNRLNFLTAANQIGKSTVNISKCIDWATDKSKWPRLWRTPPRQFWYLYPSYQLATQEFETKWEPDILPGGEFRKSGEYAWDCEYEKGYIKQINFKSGVTVYFKAYTQDVNKLQAGTVHGMFADEELPENLFEELSFRMEAVDGHYHNVFTATLAQEKWRLTMEPGKDEKELFPDAFKLQVSMYDCQFFEDGTPSHWTNEKIEGAKARCRSPAEIKKRIYGRFVADEGLKYPTYDPARNLKEFKPVDPTWYLFAGIDVGSGDEGSHKSSICFVAVKPDYSEGVAFYGWRGDNTLTTAGDVLNKYQEMRGKKEMTGAYFDWACKDFETIATRVGEAVVPAEKSHEIGEQILNVLFKHEMLTILDTPELQKLSGELQSLRKETAKKDAKDDFCDALRYAVSKIPWNWEKVQALEHQPQPEVIREKSTSDLRREFALNQDDFLNKVWNAEDEIDAWNELYEE